MAAVFMCVAMVDDVLISVITLLNSEQTANQRYTQSRGQQFCCRSFGEATGG